MKKNKKKGSKQYIPMTDYELFKENRYGNHQLSLVIVAVIFGLVFVAISMF